MKSNFDFKMVLNLGYRIIRLVTGESGIVRRVRSLEKSSSFTFDSYNNPPQEITFENPLGEIITRNSPNSKPFTLFNNNLKWLYPRYKPGDEFP